MQMFRKVEVYIPLLDAIKMVPRYAKFLKSLFPSKKKLKGNEMATTGENISAVLQSSVTTQTFYFAIKHSFCYVSLLSYLFSVLKLYFWGQMCMEMILDLIFGT